MIIPATFECNGLTWRVQFEDISDSHGKYGVTVFKIQTILIDTSISQQLKEATFLHELMHVAIWAAGLDQSIDAFRDNIVVEEAVVSGMSNVLFGLLKSCGIIKVEDEF
jgi:hypothetical protein